MRPTLGAADRPSSQMGKSWHHEDPRCPVTPVRRHDGAIVWVLRTASLLERVVTTSFGAAYADHLLRTTHGSPGP
jgi:hypothetical protein